MITKILFENINFCSLFISQQFFICSNHFIFSLFFRVGQQYCVAKKGIKNESFWCGAIVEVASLQKKKKSAVKFWTRRRSNQKKKKEMHNHLDSIKEPHEYTEHSYNKKIFELYDLHASHSVYEEALLWLHDEMDIRSGLEALIEFGATESKKSLGSIFSDYMLFLKQNLEIYGEHTFSYLSIMRDLIHLYKHLNEKKELEKRDFFGHFELANNENERAFPMEKLQQVQQCIMEQAHSERCALLSSPPPPSSSSSILPPSSSILPPSSSSSPKIEKLEYNMRTLVNRDYILHNVMDMDIMLWIMGELVELYYDQDRYDEGILLNHCVIQC
ncbi:hypothetical protein RFI_23815, partial [Reticulomyxa filosa]